MRRWHLFSASLVLLATAGVSAPVPVSAECTGQTNRFPAFLDVAPTAELVVIGTVTEPLRGHDGALATFRLRVDEVLEGEAPATIDILGLRSGLPVTGDPGCRENAFAYARVGDVLAIALDGQQGDATSVNTYAFIEGRPPRGLVRADRVTADEVRAAVPPEVIASPDPSASPVPVPLTGRAASDAFWEPLREGGEREGIGPRLADAVRAADLVVTGRPVDLRPWDPGPSVPAALTRLYLLRIAVDEVIKGEPVSAEPGFIDLFVDGLPGFTLDDINALVPDGERSLFLLYNLGERNRLHGQPQEEIDATREVYTRILEAVSVIRDLDGLAFTTVLPFPDTFPAEYVGGPFSIVLDAVRQEAARQAARS
jgi:hypothetical protein